MAIGSIIHSIAEMLPTETVEPPVSTVGERKGSNALVARTALLIGPVAEPEMPQGIGPVGDKPIGRAVEQAAGKLIVLVAEPAVGKPIDQVAGKPIGPAAAVELRVQAVAEIRLVTALYPRVQRAVAAVPWAEVAVVAIAEVPPGRAAAGVATAWAAAE